MRLINSVIKSADYSGGGDYFGDDFEELVEEVDEIKCNELEWVPSVKDRMLEMTSRSDTGQGIKVTFKVQQQHFCNISIDISKYGFKVTFKEEDEPAKSCDVIETTTTLTKPTKRTTTIQIATTPITILAKRTTSIKTTTTKLLTSTSTTATTSTTKPPRSTQWSGSIVLRRWRDWSITVTAWDPNNPNTTNTTTFSYSTKAWSCDSQNTISIEQFCNGHRDCPNGEDEDENTCKFSKLPGNFGYLVYTVMGFVIATYFIHKKVHKVSLSERVIELRNIVTAVEKKVVLGENDNSEACSWNNIVKDAETKIATQLQTQFSNTSNQYKNLLEAINFVQNDFTDTSNEVFKQIRKVEETTHCNSESVYDCILQKVGGDSKTLNKIISPDKGTIIVQILKKLRISNIFLAKLEMGAMFIFLCLHLFDYVKDIGELKIKFL